MRCNTLKYGTDSLEKLSERAIKHQKIFNDANCQHPFIEYHSFSSVIAINPMEKYQCIRVDARFINFGMTSEKNQNS